MIAARREPADALRLTQWHSAVTARQFPKTHAVSVPTRLFGVRAGMAGHKWYHACGALSFQSGQQAAAAKNFQ